MKALNAGFVTPISKPYRHSAFQHIVKTVEPRKQEDMNDATIETFAQTLDVFLIPGVEFPLLGSLFML